MSDRARRGGGRRALAVALVALAAVAAGSVAQLTGVLAAAERSTVAARFALRHVPKPKAIVVVAIDDQTFDALRQQWPFPRSLHGRVIDRLHAAGAREIVYDIQFTEPTTAAQDSALYDAIGRAGGAILATSESDADGHTNVLGGDANLAAIHARAAASNLLTESDGTIARFPYDVSRLVSVPVAAAQRLGTRVQRSAFADGGALIDYRGKPGTFETISFSAVLRGHFDPAAVRGKVVVVGAAAPSLQDIHSTPAGGGALMSGPEVEANAIWSALHGFPLRQAPPALDFVLIALLALVPALVRLRRGIVAAALAGLVLAPAYLVAAQLAFDAGTVLAVFAPLLALTVCVAALVVDALVFERRERRRVSEDNELLARLVRERTAELERTQLEIVRRLGAAVESRDAETGMHVERIGRLCEDLALAVGMGAHDAEMLRHAAALHDVGKISVPDRILLKPGALDPQEWETMKTHAQAGSTILAESPSPLIQLAQVIARTHHERWDGSGYPAGMRGEEIPLAGRICAICDAFDAIVSDRPYKRARSVAFALEELRRCRGGHFDPELVDAFVGMICARPDEWSSDSAPLEWTVEPSHITRAPERS